MLTMLIVGGQLEFPLGNVVSHFSEPLGSQNSYNIFQGAEMLK